MAREDIPRLQAEVLASDRATQRPWFLADANGQRFINRSISADQVLFSIVRAREIRTKADSHRDFHVGACGIIHDAHGVERKLVHGANFKDAAGVSEIDIHAEDFIIQKIRSGETLMALAVVAPTQPDSASGIEHPTLHPCFKCRPKIKKLGEATANALIICALPDITAVQWGDINDFIAANEHRPHNLSTALFNETPEPFRPSPIKSDQPIHLTENLAVKTDEWDTKVTFPVQEWLLERALSYS